MKHYAPKYFQHPPHQITVALIGLGGTGSQVLSSLARINKALIGLAHPGLHVTAYDHDKVSPSNLGRQLFAESDLGMNKATVLISRINRFFGTDWSAIPSKFCKGVGYNIVISCIDTAAGRVELSDMLKGSTNHQPYDECYYWLDLGNSAMTGQVVLGTVQSIPQPGNKKQSLKTIVQHFPGIKKIKEEEQGPSCSIAEALERQDLFINSTLAQFGCDLIWKLIRHGYIEQRGCYVNLQTLTVNPINI